MPTPSSNKKADKVAQLLRAKQWRDERKAAKEASASPTPSTGTRLPEKASASPTPSTGTRRPEKAPYESPPPARCKTPSRQERVDARAKKAASTHTSPKKTPTDAPPANNYRKTPTTEDRATARRMGCARAREWSNQRKKKKSTTTEDNAEVPSVVDAQPNSDVEDLSVSDDFKTARGATEAKTATSVNMDVEELVLLKNDFENASKRLGRIIAKHER